MASEKKAKWYSFNLLGATASHAFSGDGFGKIITPVIILGVVLVSYRPWKNQAV